METYTRKQMIEFAAYCASHGCDSDTSHLRDMLRRWKTEMKRENEPEKKLKGYVLAFRARDLPTLRYWTGTGLSTQLKDAWMYPPGTNMRAEVDRVRRLAIVRDLSLPEVMEVR